MPNTFDAKEFRLPEFAEYLLRKQLVKEEHARFYVFWVRKFLEKDGADSNLTLTERLDHYLLGLQAENHYADWQIAQAERAIRLYFHNFQTDTDWKGTPEKRIDPRPDGTISRSDALAETCRVLRLIGGRGRPPSIWRNDIRRMAYVGGPTAPSADFDMTGHPNRRKLAHPQPIERFNKPIVLFVTICAIKQDDVFNKQPVQMAFLNAWRMAIQWRVGLYMLMPDHIHLFCIPGVNNPEPVSKWAAYWKRLSGQNERELMGVWQRDVWDTQMRNRAQYEEKLFYVRMNPVRKGLANRPEEWPYSGIINSILW